MVTVRDRDTMEQDHVHVDELVAYIQKKIEVLILQKTVRTRGETFLSRVLFKIRRRECFV